MYRLLIVDDEPVIVNVLIQLFQENTEFELDVCQSLLGRREALNIAKKMKLDILVSDIRTQKSGLQLVDDIAYYWPHCRIIFLTGFTANSITSRKPCAREPDNYILKTEGIEPDLWEPVKAACQKLDEGKPCAESGKKRRKCIFKSPLPCLKRAGRHAFAGNPRPHCCPHGTPV
ncbi:response regulator [Paenibacillus sp. JTLBN-2024]